MASQLLEGYLSSLLDEYELGRKNKMASLEKENKDLKIKLKAKSSAIKNALINTLFFVLGGATSVGYLYIACR